MKQQLLTIFLILCVFKTSTSTTPTHCPAEDNNSDQTQCTFDLVETIPEGLTYNESINSISTGDAVLSLIQSSTTTLDIGHFYFTLKGSDVMNNASDEWTRPGELILNAIKEASKRGVKVSVVIDSGKSSSVSDIQELESVGIEVRKLNVSKLVGAGILHTKLVIADNSSFYVGSGNMDWRSLTQVKELGIKINHCDVLAKDIWKIFQIYWINSDANTSSAAKEILLPSYLDTNINFKNQINLKLNSILNSVFISSSPFKLNTIKRTNDIDAVLSVINNADKYVNIAVMDYYPMFLYRKSRKFWPLIDDAIKRAAIERGVHVRLLCSLWTSTRKEMVNFLKSLQAFSTWNKSFDTRTSKYQKKGSIEVKLFKVPANEEQKRIPYARVNHNKYMVSDKSGYIGTNNWSADYFVSTAGIGFVVTDVNNTCYSDNSLRQSLKHVFDRDWFSNYSDYV